MANEVLTDIYVFPATSLAGGKHSLPLGKAGLNYICSVCSNVYGLGQSVRGELLSSLNVLRGGYGNEHASPETQRIQNRQRPCCEYSKSGVGAFGINATLDPVLTTDQRVAVETLTL